MSADDDINQPRAGTYADLARRMDRMETKHEDLAKEVSTLTATTGQVVLNQDHAEKINELRFASLNTAVSQIGSDQKAFMTRIEGIISGEVQTAATRAGTEMVADYQKWRKEMTEWRDQQDDLRREAEAANSARSAQRASAWNISNRTLGVIILVGNFLLGAWVAVSNLT